MNKFILTPLTFFLFVISCHAGQIKPDEVTLKIPYKSNIWPKSKVTVQMDTGVMVSINLISTGKKEDIKKFYDKAYSDWQTVNKWSSKKTSVNHTGKQIWKAWKRGEYFLILSIKDGYKNKYILQHTYTKLEGIYL